MNNRQENKLTAIFRKLFKSSNSNKNDATGSPGKAQGSPAHRLLRGYKDKVSPATSSQPIQQPPDYCNKKDEEATLQNKNVRARRLMKEFRYLQRLQNYSKNEQPIFTVELVDDNLFEWHVKLYKVDTDSELMRDMIELGIRYILLHLIFPDNFPFVPPFMRLITPRIEKGFVMEGGAICMELLTPRGWASAYTVEAIIMQFAASVVKGQGRIQRKKIANKGQRANGFTKKSAEESFRSLVRTHDKYGWVTPSLADG